ncbi:MAG: heme exporter protein CcmD [Hydrogenophilaceae bacterium]
MMWASWGEFWAMGGYGLYVWGSYGAAFILILIEIISLKRGQKQTLQRLKRMKTWESE